LSEQPLDDLVARLERERLAADRLYNDALTAVDRAIQSVPALAAMPPVPGTAGLDALNRGWNLLPAGPPPLDGSLKGRLRAFVWRLVGPPLHAQTAFNAVLVEYLNRDAESRRHVAEALTALRDGIVRELEALVRFESLLVQFLQTITVYVDTKDRSVGGSELRERLALTEQRMLALKRDVDRAVERREVGAPTAPIATRAPIATITTIPPGPTERAAESVTYVAFEDRFRGATADVRRRVEEYLPLLESANDVVDAGCGRGELLALLHSRGVRARGVDANQAMVDLCKSQGLDVEYGDALSYLERQSDGTIGGLVAIQVVEHFEPGYLAKFLQAAYHKMKPGAPLVLETINVACWMAFFETYIRDLTHQRPLHPDTLRYLVQASGFSSADVRYRRPVSDADRLEPVEPAGMPDDLKALAAALNAHAAKLNARLFSSMDYTVVARR
jgi:O-antigen chain-terminating methyltransferase